MSAASRAQPTDRENATMVTCLPWRITCHTGLGGFESGNAQHYTKAEIALLVFWEEEERGELARHSTIEVMRPPHRLGL